MNVGRMFLKVTIVVIVGALSVLLGITSDGLVFQYGNFGTPGMYIEHWLFPPPSGVGLASLGGGSFIIMFSIDSLLWFFLIYGTGAVVLRFWRRSANRKICHAKHTIVRRSS